MRSNLHPDLNHAFKLEAHWQVELIEQTCTELGGAIPRERIREIVLEATARYADAKVTAFVPILVRRFVRERLKQEIQSTGQKDETLFHAGAPRPAGRQPGIDGSIPRA